MTAPKTQYDLFAWQEAMKLIEAVHRNANAFLPKKHLALWHRLRVQPFPFPPILPKARHELPENTLVEFVGISCGSLAELQTQLELPVRLGYLAADAESIRQAVRVCNLVRGLREALRPERA